MEQIKNKDSLKRLQLAGKLGNYFRMWNTVPEVRDARYNGWLTVRARRASDRALFIPTIKAEDVITICSGEVMVMTGVSAFEVHGHERDMYFQECPAPETARIINLEAMRDERGLYVRYALNDPTNLRHSLENNGVDADGLTARHVLETYLEEDIEQIEDIWSRYPGAVIEASRFTRKCGVFGSKTVVWEARDF